jgi:predicted Zn-dependent protease
LDDETLVRLALEILDKGGMPAFAVACIVVAWLKFGRPGATNTESEMAAALRDLSATVKANHEVAEKQREELKDGMSDLGQRVARIEGRLERK